MRVTLDEGPLVRTRGVVGSASSTPAIDGGLDSCDGTAIGTSLSAGTKPWSDEEIFNDGTITDLAGADAMGIK
jgi:hypothetical protein